MKFNFKKIASVLASAVMLTSTIGFASAATYPAPFSASGGAVVYGSAAYVTDATAAFKVEKSIQSTSTTTNVATSGETTGLFTGSSKININDTIAQVKSTLTSTDLPTVLKKGSFSGNVDATYTQTIDFGTTTNLNSPRLIFAKQPTSSDDPAYGFALSTNTANPIYNATVNFNKAINFTDSNSKNQEITLFGQKYTIGSGTDATNLVLFKSATKINFDSTGTTSAEATINGQKYTVELVTASTTTATISVTSEDGTSEQKEITEGYSKKVNGITIAVNTADSNNQKYTASIVAGADKITLTSASAVTVGDEGTQVDGTLVSFTNNCTSMTKIVISVAAKDSDNDAIMPGQSYIDPVYGTFKLDFSAGLNVPVSNNTSNREDIVIRSSGDDKMTVKFTNNRGNEATIPFIKNWTTQMGGMQLQNGDDGKNITVIEGGAVFKGEYVMVGNEDQGYLLKLSTLTNSSSNYADDKIKFTDAFDSTQVFDATITGEGSATVTIGGKVYSVTYYANDVTTTDTWNVTLNYPDSTGTIKVVWPTMQTSQGAKVAFYEPVVIDMGATTGVRIPNGNGYTNIDWINNGPGGNGGTFNFSGLGTGLAYVSNATGGVNASVGQFRVNFNATGDAGIGNLTRLTMFAPDTYAASMTPPALILIEEKDDNSAYNGAVVTFEGLGTSTDGVGVSDYSRTWSADTQWDNIALASNSNKADDADLFGTVALTDSTDSDQKWVTVSYPDEQVYAQLYGAAEGAVITGGSSSSSTGALTAVEDKDLDSVKDMNLIVVGGSCVNKAAAKILGSDNPVCGADFTAATQVGASQYIIKTVASPYNADKIAVLVAGYEAVDTINAVDTLLEGAKTDADSSQVYPIQSTTA